MTNVPAPQSNRMASDLATLWAGKSRFVVTETGFDAGQNFLKIWAEFERTTTTDQHLHYYAIEKHPLSLQGIQKQNEPDARLEKLLSLYPMRVEGWHTIRLSAQITLTLIFDAVDRALPEMQTMVDDWFLNKFEPSDILFQNIKRLSKAGARLSALTTNDAIQNGLRQSGFTVSTDQQITTAIFENGTTPILIKKSKPEKVAIIGGGIAGATLAYSLSSRGCNVTIFEKNGLASGGSGNDRGLCNPRISAGKGSEADFYSPAFNLAHRLFADISKEHDIGFQACGSLHMISDDNKDKRYHGFKKNWGWHDDHARIISAEESSDAAGIRILQPSLYFEDAGMVSPKKVTQHLAQSAKIVMREMTSLEEVGSNWRIDGEDFDCVILAGSFDVLQFPYTRTLPIEKVRGQVTRIKASPLYNQLKTNLCYGGYASVAENGEAILGSTFQTWITDPALRPEDDIDNIAKLEQVAPHMAEGLTIIGGRASFRSAAKDRAPVIGQIHGVENLYTSTAHGSHGILSSVMGAEFLTSKIMGDAHIFPKSVERFLSPSRFKIY
jgi:tRNA 5-methylaminomethyl-2-thiouridine biosynthesis bifunctional protein